MKTLLVAAAMAATCLAQPQAPAATENSAYHALVVEAQAHINRLNIQQFREWRDAKRSFLLVDVRESEEWVKGRAAGAVHICKGTIEKEIEAKIPTKDAVIVLYCHSGARSALAAENLKRMGYSKVYSLDGGLTAYEAAGLPIEK